MKQLYLLIFCTLGLKTLLIGQEINIGLNIGTYAFQKHKLEGSVFKPENSNYTYTLEPSKSNVIEEFKVLNSLSFGANLKFTRKKISACLEPQMTLEVNNFRFTEPFETVRVLNKKAFRIPLLFSYQIIKSINSPYILVGAMVSFENNYDYQQPNADFLLGNESLYENDVNFGDNHFHNVFYNNSNSFNYIIGFGQKINKFNFSGRYINTLTPNKLIGKKWQIELNLAYYFLSNKDLTRKNYLYEE